MNRAAFLNRVSATMERVALTTILTTTWTNEHDIW